MSAVPPEDPAANAHREAEPARGFAGSLRSRTASLDRLLTGVLEIRGRIMPASNGTYLAEVLPAMGLADAVRDPDPGLDPVSDPVSFPGLAGDEPLRTVYKPISGERPLWDFPNGTLAGRELAAFLVSEALGLDVVPLTVLREGPLGLGMVQLWCDPDEEVEAVDLCEINRVPPGFLHVLDAEDGGGRPISLVHEDSAPLRAMALFDVLVNNADRKGGHVLAMPGGHRYGVDHGICFHVEDKLRTVLWGWADQSLTTMELEAVAGLDEQVVSGVLGEMLAELLTTGEIDAIRRRARRLLRHRRLPTPSGRWPAIPWPAF